MVEVIATDEFRQWYGGLSDAQAEDVDVAVGLLEHHGVTLRFPHSSAIKGSDKLRELRIQSKGTPLRVFYAFDPKRQAVLLIGGDKTGDGRFYEEMVPYAEKLFAQYLDEQSRGLHDEVEDS